MLRAKLHSDADRVGYNTLTFAAFFEAADRNFAKDHSREAIIEFVAWARSRSDNAVQERSTRI
jgi:hypothetical protein